MLVVLVVDDEPGVRRLLDIVLNQPGWVVRDAPDAETALRMVEEIDPDVVLTDVRLPGMDGTQLAEQIRNDGHHHHAQVILMSAYGKPRRVPSGTFLPKPFDLDNVIQTVRSYEH